MIHSAGGNGCKYGWKRAINRREKAALSQRHFSGIVLRRRLWMTSIFHRLNKKCFSTLCCFAGAVFLFPPSCSSHGRPSRPHTAQRETNSARCSAEPCRTLCARVDWPCCRQQADTWGRSIKCTVSHTAESMQLHTPSHNRCKTPERAATRPSAIICN